MLRVVLVLVVALCAAVAIHFAPVGEKPATRPETRVVWTAASASPPRTSPPKT